MRSLRLSLLGTVLLGLLALSSPASAGPESPRRPDPTDLQQLRFRIAPLLGKLNDRFEEAAKDWRSERVEIYQSYQVVNFEDRRREVRVKELLGYLADKSVPYEVRKEIVKAVTAPLPKTFDKDIEVGRGSRRPRNDVSVQYVLPMLDDDEQDGAGRQLANDYLIAMHGQQTDADILGYKPLEPKTWKAAKAAWRKVLK